MFAIAVKTQPRYRLLVLLLARRAVGPDEATSIGSGNAPCGTAGANPELHLHDLRHTGGTLAAQTGATLKELMTRLGHSTPRAALIYQHTTSERDKKIADALNLMIEGRLIVPPADDPDGPSGALIPA